MPGRPSLRNICRSRILRQSVESSPKSVRSQLKSGGKSNSPAPFRRPIFFRTVGSQTPRWGIPPELLRAAGFPASSLVPVGTELLRTVEDLPTICPSEPPGIPSSSGTPLPSAGRQNSPERRFPQLGRLPRPPKSLSEAFGISRNFSGIPSGTPPAREDFPVALGDTPPGPFRISGLQSRVLGEESLRALVFPRPLSGSFGFPASSCFPGRSPGEGSSGLFLRVTDLRAGLRFLREALRVASSVWRGSGGGPPCGASSEAAPGSGSPGSGSPGGAFE